MNGSFAESVLGRSGEKSRHLRLELMRRTKDPTMIAACLPKSVVNNTDEEKINCIYSSKGSQKATNELIAIVEKAGSREAISKLKEAYQQNCEFDLANLIDERIRHCTVPVVNAVAPFQYQLPRTADNRKKKENVIFHGKESTCNKPAENDIDSCKKSLVVNHSPYSQQESAYDREESQCLDEEDVKSEVFSNSFKSNSQKSLIVMASPEFDINAQLQDNGEDVQVHHSAEDSSTNETEESSLNNICVDSDADNLKGNIVDNHCLEPDADNLKGNIVANYCLEPDADNLKGHIGPLSTVYTPENCGQERLAVIVNCKNSSNAAITGEDLETLKRKMTEWHWKVEIHNQIEGFQLKNVLSDVVERNVDLLFMVFIGYAAQFRGQTYLLPSSPRSLGKHNFARDGYSLHSFLENARAKACLTMIDCGSANVNDSGDLSLLLHFESSEQRPNYAVAIRQPLEDSSQRASQRIIKNICNWIQQNQSICLHGMFDHLREKGDNWKVISKSRSVLPLQFQNATQPETYCVPGIIIPKPSDRRYILHVTASDEKVDYPNGWNVEVVKSVDNQSLKNGLEDFFERMKSTDVFTTLIVSYDGPVYQYGNDFVLTGCSNFGNTNENAAMSYSTTLEWLMDNLLESVIGPKLICLNTTGLLEYDEEHFSRLAQEIMLVIPAHRTSREHHVRKYQNILFSRLREERDSSVLEIFTVAKPMKVYGDLELVGKLFEKIQVVRRLCSNSLFPYLMKLEGQFKAYAK